MARIAFCQDVMVEYMAYMCMSAVLKKAGHSVEVFFDGQRGEDLFIDELKRFAPDVVGFSLLSPAVPWALRIARRVKKEMGAVTVFGNVHAMINPDIIQDEGVDIVCLAEGELLLRELADSIDKKRPYDSIESFLVKTDRGVIRNPMPKTVVDLERMPFHDRSLYDKYFFFRHSTYLRFMCGRGCPYRCSFCTNAFLVNHYGARGYVRKRSVASVIEELECLVKARKPKHIFFIDEVLWVDNDWLRNFLSLYKERINIPFTANFRWGKGLTEDDIVLFKAAKAKALIVAVETADEGQRMKLMNKPVTDEHVFQVAGWLKKYKIDFCVSAFFGLPGDTVDIHIDRLDFFRKIKPTYLWTTFFQPYQGIRLTELPEIKKHIPENRSFESTLHHDIYLDLPDKKALVNLKKAYYLLLICPWLVPLFRRLIRYNIPALFDIIFLGHFTFYAFRFERLSLSQYLYHLKTFGMNAVIKRKISSKPITEEKG